MLSCLTSLCVRRYSSAVSNAVNVFADPRSAKFLAAAASAQSLPTFEGTPPEVVVTGRANVGKSTLLNAVLGRNDLVFTSKKAGRTKELNFFRVGPQPGNLILVDAPGYGSRGRPEWGRLFDNYVQHRSELRRIYILINSIHGVKDMDFLMLQHLSKQCELAQAAGRHVTLQAILTKADVLHEEKAKSQVRKAQRLIFEAAPMCLPAIVSACGKPAQLGIDTVRESIVEACGLGYIKSKEIDSS